MTSFDVIVLGLGGMGSATVQQLAARGCRVLGIDHFTPPHNHGSSHGRTRVIRQAYFESPSYVPLLLRAYELWHQTEHASSQSLFLECGALMLGAPDSEVIVGSLNSARQFTLPHTLLEFETIKRRYSFLSLPKHTVGLLEPRAGLVYCDKAVGVQLALATRHGAQLHFGEHAHSWTATPDGGVIVQTDRKTYEAAQLVLTPGPWSPGLVDTLSGKLSVERQLLFWFQPPRGTAPFTPDHCPIYLWQPAQAAMGCPYGFPAVDGPLGGVKIAVHRKPIIERCTPETVDRRIHEIDIAEMRTVLRSFIPALDGEMIHATVCLYTMSPDHHFIIGEHPEHPQVKIAAGFSGHGFKFSPVVGEILADLTLQGVTRHDIGLFNPRRFA